MSFPRQLRSQLPSLLFIALAAFSGTVANGGVIAFDGFEDYAAGSGLHAQSGGTGFSSSWFIAINRRPETTVVNGGLSYSNGAITIGGGARAMQYVSSEAGIEILAQRDLPAIADTVYLSFLYQNSVDTLDVSDDF
ncbi:MAG: hypothetical protein N2C14_18845, partial [Planctomycetales bacterium]